MSVVTKKKAFTNGRADILVQNCTNKGGPNYFKYTCACDHDGCNEVFSKNFSKEVDEETIRNIMKKGGWLFGQGGYKAYCSTHALMKKKGGPRPSKKTELTSLPRTGPSTKQKRDIRSALEMYFVPERGTYTDDMSDREIGKQLDVPWAWVRDIREEWFGSLRVDEDATKILADLNAVEGRIRAHREATEQLIHQAEAEITKLKRRLLDALGRAS